MATRKWINDVFLCFRGQDTRYNFISHLYYALEKANVKTFIDDKLPRGDTISLSLFKAIETSRFAVIVFSPNFASSTWCLDEVVKILECRQSRGQLVHPVFYHVDPSAVRNQTGVYQPIFSKLEEDFWDDLKMVETWRLALREAANLAGWTIHNNVNEAEVVRQIVDEAVSSRLLERNFSRNFSFFPIVRSED